MSPRYHAEQQTKKTGIRCRDNGQREQIKKKHDGQASAVLLLKISQTWLMDEDYSASFLAAFFAGAFLAGFSSAGSSALGSALAALAALAGLASASREAFSSARAERSPRVVFSTFGRSSCGSAGAAFLAAFGAASLRSSHVRRCETRIRLASRLRISRHRV